MMRQPIRRCTVWRMMVVAWAVLLMGGSNATKHHCVHDEKARRLEESVNPASLVSPQLLAVDTSSSDLAVHAFLDAVGAAAHRRLSPTSSAKNFKPIRIAFDLSKLTNDPGRACTREGEVVKVDGGGSYRCSGGDVLTPDKRDYVVTVLLKNIESYFEAILSVQRVVGNLVVKGLSCPPSDGWACCANRIPKTFKTQGVADADFVLHVTARPTTGATIAWALPCNIDQFGRPISGQANFGPGAIDVVTPSARTEQIGAALHEMTHALVFSKGRFGDFRQPLNGPKWGYDNVVDQSRGSGGIWVSKIVTPNVARQAKVQFNCFDWVNAGVELENGDSGSADFSSHWEKRLLMNEYMTATSSYDPVYSAMTLALFEDSGWYKVSYKNVQVLPWGYMEGCSVAQRQCSAWNSRYICSDSVQTGCTADYTSKASCNIASYTSSIPAGFQYFQDPTLGGRDGFADFCPFYRADSNGDCRGIGRVSTVVNSANYMEEVGQSSRCFQSSLSKTANHSVARRASCYKVVGCSSESLKLSIGGRTVLCPLGGGEISVSGFRGTLVCPVANRLCKLLQNQCSGNGVLLSSGECECNPGFVGQDCSDIPCPVSSINGQECGGSTQGNCDYNTGKCSCAELYTGLTCSELLCAVNGAHKNTSECSGHGECDQGECTCSDGYSGKTCECVPGCVPASCGSNGTCDCTTGGCSCDFGFSGVNCTEPFEPSLTELDDDVDSNSFTDTVADKEYRFYKIALPSSTYDITFSVRYENKNGEGVDVDLYGSFIDPYPTSLSGKSNLFVSDFSIGDRDEINLCGSLGVFPRGLNDTFRRCARPTASYLLETPGYFYLSVFGFAGGDYELAIVTDKCKNVTCSSHGDCGVNFPGVCTCDRYWTGDDCSIPKCGPDCQDLGTCGSTLLPPSFTIQRRERSSGRWHKQASSPIASVEPPANGALLRPSECYDNGICRVDSTTDTPRCLCDDAFTFTNPTPMQDMCRDLLPSVASVQAFTEPFTFTTLDNNDVLDINTWALFSIVVKDDWEMLLVDMAILAPDTDGVLVVSKASLPSMLLLNAQQADYAASSASRSSPEFTDFDGWMAGASSRKVILSRASSTLASGLYYIGVSNSIYAEQALSYTLAVHTTSDCSATPVCSNGGICDSNASHICTCTDGFFGQYCDYQSSSTMLSAPSHLPLDPSSTHSKTNDSDATSANTTSYIAYHTTGVERVAVGNWSYYSFGIADPSIRVVQFRMVILNDQTRTNAPPMLPLLLVRGPCESGFPTLFTQNLQDFASVSQHNATQTVSLAVDGVCAPTASTTGGYKVAIFNRDTSGEALQYRMEVELFQSLDVLFPASTCGSDRSADDYCFGNGKCQMATVTNSQRPASPACECKLGWVGVQCNSPMMFAAPHLWSEINNTLQLCATCNSTFALARGDLKVFRMPVSRRSDSGIRLRLRREAISPTNGTTATVYVSETLPRSMYDFTYISKANTSFGGDHIVELPPKPLAVFWVAVFSDYAVPINTSSSTWPDNALLESRVTMTRFHPSKSIRRLTDSDSTSPTKHSPPVFTLEAETWDPILDYKESPAVHPSNHSSVLHWLFQTPAGLATVISSVALVALAIILCIQRQHHQSTRPRTTTDDAKTVSATDVELGGNAALASHPTWRRFFKAKEKKPAPSSSASACA